MLQLDSRPFATALRTVLPAALAIAAAQPTSAQCIGPDGLTGACWEPQQLQLPDLNGFDMPGAGICWSFCDPGVKDPTRMRFTPPVEVLCGEFQSEVKIETGTGAPVLNGTATMDYTRTWSEAGPNGEYQVYRFVTKIDFFEDAVAPNACWNPPCLGGPNGYDTCFWYGYVDYALKCGGGGFENSVALFHSCDDYAHNSFLSDRPAPAGGFHPTSYFGLVGPDTPANPFNPGMGPGPAQGALIAEAVRNVPDFPGQLCPAEERVAQGGLQLFGEACLCPLIPSNGQSASNFFGIGTCPDPAGAPSSWQSLSIANPNLGAKWFNLIGTRLGSWTTNASYPGPEAPFAEEMFAFYHDSCAVQGVGPADTLDMFYGAQTRGGYPVFGEGPIGQLSQNFLDLASNYSKPFVALPLMGSVQKTDHLIYVNVP